MSCLVIYAIRLSGRNRYPVRTERHGGFRAVVCTELRKKFLPGLGMSASEFESVPSSSLKTKADRLIAVFSRSLLGLLLR